MRWRILHHDNQNRQFYQRRRDTERIVRDIRRSRYDGTFLVRDATSFTKKRTRFVVRRYTFLIAFLVFGIDTVPIWKPLFRV